MINHTTSHTASKNVPVVLDYQGHSISGRGEMLSLTDMWRAAGSDFSRRPVEWSRSADSKRFIETVAETLNVGISHLLQVTSGRSGSTFAHWQVALAYAKYLSPAFHMWCNTVVRAHMEGEPAPAKVKPLPSASSRETRLFFNQALTIGKLAGLTGNQLILAANRSTKKHTGSDILGAMGLDHLAAPVQDPLVIPTKLGQDLGISAQMVNQLLKTLGLQEQNRDHDARSLWRATPAGERLGATLVDVDRTNGSGPAQQLKWPSRTVDVLREHVADGASRHDH